MILNSLQHIKAGLLLTFKGKICPENMKKIENEFLWNIFGNSHNYENLFQGINYFSAIICGFSISIQKTFILYIFRLDFHNKLRNIKRKISIKIVHWYYQLSDFVFVSWWNKEWMSSTITKPNILFIFFPPYLHFYDCSWWGC